MARPLRIVYDGAVYHITSRGNAKNPIFKNNQDRSALLDILNKVNSRYNWFCHAYCLMNNHYHFVIETPDGNISQGMRQLNGTYTQLFNFSNKRVGHLFQGRYKAILIQKDRHLLEVCRYVVLNPVRARVVEKPEDWKWSSYMATTGQAKAHPCLTEDYILGRFGRNRRGAVKEYKKFIEDGIGERDLWRNVKAQSLLGEEEFIERLQYYIKGYEEIKDIPKNQRFIGRPDLKLIFNVSVLNNRRERNKLIIKAVEKYGYSQREIADFIGMHFASISRLVNRKC